MGNNSLISDGENIRLLLLLSCMCDMPGKVIFFDRTQHVLHWDRYGVRLSIIPNWNLMMIFIFGCHLIHLYAEMFDV